MFYQSDLLGAFWRFFDNLTSSNSRWVLGVGRGLGEGPSWLHCGLNNIAIGLVFLKYVYMDREHQIAQKCQDLSTTTINIAYTVLGRRECYILVILWAFPFILFVYSRY